MKAFQRLQVLNRWVGYQEASMYVCMHACMHVSIYLSIYVSVCVCHSCRALWENRSEVSKSGAAMTSRFLQWAWTVSGAWMNFKTVGEGFTCLPQLSFWQCQFYPMHCRDTVLWFVLKCKKTRLSLD
jgi:hypothetical protein